MHLPVYKHVKKKVKKRQQHLIWWELSSSRVVVHNHSHQHKFYIQTDLCRKCYVHDSFWCLCVCVHVCKQSNFNETLYENFKLRFIHEFSCILCAYFRVRHENIHQHIDMTYVLQCITCFYKHRVSCVSLIIVYIVHINGPFVCFHTFTHISLPCRINGKFHQLSVNLTNEWRKKSSQANKNNLLKINWLHF